MSPVSCINILDLRTEAVVAVTGEVSLIVDSKNKHRFEA